MFRTSLLLSLFCAWTSAVTALGPQRGQIKSIVTFGDSYSDVVSLPFTAWPLYVADYGNLTLHPFARAGATCSNNLTFRPFPPVFESQLPTFLEEKANGTIKINEDQTVYTLWIGTNDVGVSALLTGDQTPGVTIVDTVSCAVNWVKTLYANGARNFVFQNMVPLQHVILYSPDSYPNKYWDLQRNTTEWSLMITELTTSGNEIARLMLQDLAPTLHGAHLGLFDSHGLFTDILANPQNYLNGTAPLNTTGAVDTCVFQLNMPNSSVCNLVNGTDRDSFVWYDELHPSEQSERQVARHITNAILGLGDRWITWFS